jgi:hypothetical protein
MKKAKMFFIGIVLGSRAISVQAQQITIAPALASQKDVLTDFLNKYIGWTVVKEEVARLYIKYYTPEDMDALIKFYQTPAGKKSSLVSASLQQELLAMKQAKLQAHIGEWSAFQEAKKSEAAGHN